MSFNNVRASKNSKEILRMPGIRIAWKYCDKRAGNKSRHKIGIEIDHNLREITQTIQYIIKKNYPESFPQIYRQNEFDDGGGFVELIWVSDRNIYVEEAFKIILEDKGCPIRATVE